MGAQRSPASTLLPLQENYISRSAFRICNKISWERRSRSPSRWWPSARHVMASLSRPVLPSLPTSITAFLSSAIESGEVKADDDPKLRGRLLADEYDWDVSEARKIWALGPDGTGPNMFVDTTKGVNYLLEIKESVLAGFAWASGSGPLCEEKLRGTRFNL